MTRYNTAVLAWILGCVVVCAEPPALPTERGDAMLAEYFKARVAQIENTEPVVCNSLEEWKQRAPQLREQLKEMLGLQPWPKKSPLNAKVTGTVDHSDFVVEKVQFQSRQGLYVTGNLYRPKKIEKKLPAILYVCGHGRVKEGGISYGNKVHYQHHGAWFARNGYVCLTIDTLQLGEIEGIHHGTYRYDMWWWLNRGYTPAGVEAWNCVRALDFLQSRTDVDGDRIGVTGRSGGGAYSWWIAALDERIKVAVPVAGITDLRNHVVDGCVEGHCDCMYMVNTYRWDYATVAALVAPRPLLISNTDSDRIFPLDGVVRTFEKVRKIYKLHGKPADVALHITAGPHKDTQELRIHAFRWFNHYLKNDDSLIAIPSEKFFKPPQLRVFEELPTDERNTKIQETFVPSATTVEAESKVQFDARKNEVAELLRKKAFAAWPGQGRGVTTTTLFDQRNKGLRLRIIEFESQEHVRLNVYIVQRARLSAPSLTVLNVLDDKSWLEFVAQMKPAFGKAFSGEVDVEADPNEYQSQRKMLMQFPWAMAFVAPRGVGPTAWDQNARKQVQHRRRFYLLGESLDGMRAWDVRQALAVVRQTQPKCQVWLQSQRRMAGVALFAALYEPELTRVDLHEFPGTRENGAFALNFRRVTDWPELVACVASHSKVVLYDANPERWKSQLELAEKLGWKKGQLQVRKPVPVD